MSAYSYYQPYVGYQNPYFQPPAYQQQTVPQTQQTPPTQVMTPPTIRAEIVQVENEAAAEQYPVGAGASQMMIAKDDSAIFVKTAHANEPPTLDVYIKRQPAPPKPVFDPAEYLRKDEFETRLAAFLAAQEHSKGATA